MAGLEPGQRILFDGVIAASPQVSIEGVADRLLSFMERLGQIHKGIFGRPLVITSARDGVHAEDSLHHEGRAFDYRTRDKLTDENQVFLSLVLWLSDRYQATVFDERNLPDGQHVHIEYHGE